MSDLSPGQQIQRLVTKAVRDAYDKGRESERERIIKLLEEAKVINTDHKFFLIGAIKGEQK